MVIFLTCLPLFLFVTNSCSTKSKQVGIVNTQFPNILDYSGIPNAQADRSSLTFSDQGAWFAYGFPINSDYFGGFSGPFLMTQENGVWSGKVLGQLFLTEGVKNIPIEWDRFKAIHKSFISHLEQVFTNDTLKISQTLFFSSPHTALISTEIQNITDRSIEVIPEWKLKSFSGSLRLSEIEKGVKISSEKSPAIGYIQALGEKVKRIQIADTSYLIQLKSIKINSGETKELLLTQTFIFPEYDFQKEQSEINGFVKNHQTLLQSRILEKENQLQILTEKLDTNWSCPHYRELLLKTVLTLQNNWRVAAGELKNSGLFPSYHYLWFNGFWAWDSWKHAVALAQYDIVLAKKQIRAMYDFEDDEGFIADCIYRDTTIENHNLRNTKPPLSAWAVWEIYRQDKDLDFLKEFYPKIVKQHKWWYANRDHDQDGICEYGSTDGTLIAAKWESGWTTLYVLTVARL